MHLTGTGDSEDMTEQASHHLTVGLDPHINKTCLLGLGLGMGIVVYKYLEPFLLLSRMDHMTKAQLLGIVVFVSNALSQQSTDRRSFPKTAGMGKVISMTLGKSEQGI